MIAGDLEEDRLSPQESLLNYGRLRMAAPASPSRGTLRPVGMREMWMEVILRQKLTVQFDVVSVVSAAVQQARAASSVSPQ